MVLLDNSIWQGVDIVEVGFMEEFSQNLDRIFPVLRQGRGRVEAEPHSMSSAKAGEDDVVFFDRDGEIGAQDMSFSESVLEREEVDIIGLLVVFYAEPVDLIRRGIDEGFDRFDLLDIEEMR